MLADGGFSIVIVTNQSGLNRGFFDERDLETVNARLRRELRVRGADFHALYYCPHRPEEGCGCRKPLPGLLLRAAAELNLDLSSSYMVGDREWDIEAGRAAGTKTILISNDRKAKNCGTKADFIARNLVQAALLILERNSTQKRRSPRES